MSYANVNRSGGLKRYNGLRGVCAMKGKSNAPLAIYNNVIFNVVRIPYSERLANITHKMPKIPESEKAKPRPNPRQENPNSLTYIHTHTE